jgi:16S rRNA (adenine1518-N6/adenine1519-N6)-dimethyltransferase
MKRSRRRRFGQNFLVDRSVAQRIVDLLDPEPPRVLEIGPGRGALTDHLLDRFDRVLAFELDENLVAPLVDGLAHRGLEVLHADALKADFDELLGRDAPWQVASNLPYSVGSAIVRRLMPRCDLFSRLVIMLQREVAERLVAEPGDGNHGLMALERAAWAEASLVFNVHPRAFRPVPKVTSAVVVLEPRPPAADQELIARALGIAARALTKPRKMLSNALGSEISSEMIERADLDPNARPGTIALDGWLGLAAAMAADSTASK